MDSQVIELEGVKVDVCFDRCHGGVNVHAVLFGGKDIGGLIAGGIDAVERKILSELKHQRDDALDGAAASNADYLELVA